MYGIKANIRAPHRFLRMGSLCWIINQNPGSGGEKVEIIGISRNGRKVRTWVSACDLGNFRAGWAHSESHSIYSDRSRAEQLAATLEALWSSGPVRPHAAAHGRQEVNSDFAADHTAPQSPPPA